MGAFDTKNFLDQETDQPLVRRPPLPLQDYIGLIGEPVKRDWVSPNDPTKSGVSIDFPIVLDIPSDVQESLGLTSSQITVKGGVMLDLTPDGSIDWGPGKNGSTRRYREALDMNKPGDKFSFRAMQGRAIRVRIKHREYPAGSGEFFEDVDQVAKV
jgi:hypothetical protein